MTPQEHGRDAFLALLRDAASDTEAPLQAWRSRLGKLVRTALAVSVSAVPDVRA